MPENREKSREQLLEELQLLRDQVEALENQKVEQRQVEIFEGDAEADSRAWLEHSPVYTKMVDLDFNLQYMSTAGIIGLGISIPQASHWDKLSPPAN
ncbi:MAG: hypothetical protein CMQ19_12750 [Gammaproteobacteria bacterium]|nr:hypothetical protein [Gammaproteobacteria bacterium]|tara:strand:- start:454 stop:744 length:291 start_codon:yes stop_codon:yes gene_type:complete